MLNKIGMKQSFEIVTDSVNKMMQDILEIALTPEDGTVEGEENDNLETIAKIAADYLGVCPKCGEIWAVHEGDGSCIVDNPDS